MARTNKQNTAAAAPTEQQETQQTAEQQTQEQQPASEQQQETLAEGEKSDGTGADIQQDVVPEPDASGETKEPAAEEKAEGTEEQADQVTGDAGNGADQQATNDASVEVKTTEAVEGQNAVVTEEQPVEQVDPLVAQMRNVGVNFRQKMALNKSYSASDAVSCATQLCVAIDALLREQNLERFSAAWVALVEEIKTGRKTVFAETAIYRGWRERNFMHNSPEKARKYQHIIALLTSSADIGVAETKGVFDVRGLCNRLGLSETASRNLLALYSV